MITIVFRTVFFYFFILLIYRLMGKREIGQLGIIDLIVSILIAELVAISIENYNETILVSILPIIALVLLEIGFAYLSMKSKRVRCMFDGKPSLIVCNGQINYREMIKQRYSLEDLLLSMRQKQIASLEDVEYAFLENNGRLSVFKYDRYKKGSSYPMPLIVDGVLDEDVFDKISINKKWVNTELSKNNIKIRDVFYAFYKNKKLYIINKEKMKKNN